MFTRKLCRNIRGYWQVKINMKNVGHWRCQYEPANRARYLRDMQVQPIAKAVDCVTACPHPELKLYVNLNYAHV